MSCIHCSSPPFHFQNQRHNAKIPTNLFGKFSTKRNYCNNIIISKVGVFSMNNYVEAFPTSLTLGAVARPVSAEVILQTGALMLFFYLIANFVVPQYITKSFELDKSDENEKPSSSDSRDE